jgi:hypothetical protein
MNSGDKRLESDTLYLCTMDDRIHPIRNTSNHSKYSKRDRTGTRMGQLETRGKPQSKDDIDGRWLIGTGGSCPIRHVSPYSDVIVHTEGMSWYESKMDNVKRCLE